MVIAEQATFQLLPALTDAEYAALKQDIRENGVLVPIEVDEDDNILDGHHRIRAHSELRAEGVRLPDYPRMIRAGLSDAEKRAHAIRLNINRRHLKKEQRDELIRTLRQMTTPSGAAQYSTREIAEMVGVDKKTVRNVISTGENSPVEMPTTVQGKDGKVRNATKPKPSNTVFVKNGKEQERAQKALSVLGDDMPASPVLDVKRTERLAREKESQERSKIAPTDTSVGTITILAGDFRVRGAEIPDNSVDLVFTDPPYHEQYIPLWNDLGALAARVLKPGGVLMSYSGQKHLLPAMQLLAQSLDYFWMCSIYHSNGDAQIHEKHIRNGWKPVLMYVKPPVNPSWRYFADRVTGGKEKSEHEWQQSEAEAAHYIMALCPAGGTILDPMCGGGTALAVAKRLGLRGIGIDINPASIAATKERING